MSLWTRSSRFSCAAFSLAVCSLSIADVPKAYERAVKDAAFAEEHELTDGLIPITPSNDQLVWNEDKTKLLVVTWKSNGSYERFLKPYKRTSDNPNYAVWVTAAPQVQAMCQAYTAKKPRTDEAINMRLKKYLGLAPDWNYDVFVEMWVSPDDMFRPCVDPDVSDNSCNLNFGSELPKVKNIGDYQDFYSDLYFKSYRSSAGVPWTGLGYTYDWGGKPNNDVGASEFILVPEAEYEIERVVPTVTYCSES
ncbi:MAG: hypothetical protein ACPGPF_06370 [Pontibacterium sp.]